ncbi:hypothetical protein GDO78_021799 [Eleutherodactylus coqui]|uniref:Uncharacterized protein n=1 Tax=Eleutherodactylus coqui TaxID=57060 RepID=A0A8J6E2R5_ELECQ|nr:hypothetical protein GDO78_021799 [Eleutherodactylus coqui]
MKYISSMLILLGTATALFVPYLLLVRDNSGICSQLLANPMLQSLEDLFIKPFSLGQHHHGDSLGPDEEFRVCLLGHAYLYVPRHISIYLFFHKSVVQQK